MSGSNFNFNFNSIFSFTNATTTVKNLTVKFGENPTNSPVTIINNSIYVLSTKNVVYTTSGLKALEFNFTFSDNTTITTFAKIFVTVQIEGLLSTQNAICTDLIRERGIFTSKIPFQGYTENFPINGQIEYTVFYSNGNTARKMMKPIIIVDGFDPKNKRKVQDCDCESDPKCLEDNSETTYSSYYPFPKFTTTFNADKHESIEDSMDYKDQNDVKINFMAELRSLGYDVIIINQPSYYVINPLQPTITVTVPISISLPITTTITIPNYVFVDGGADYIERNAYTLASFIQEYIKSAQNTAGSTEQLVLIGPSMGGQITRFALAYMEKKYAETGLDKWKHNARLWVSVDSPHLGANIPVGAQANIWFMAEPLGKIPAKEKYSDLNSVAGKQQSILNFDYALTSQAHNLLGSPFYTKYYNDLKNNGAAGSNGYPVTTTTFRKIAMTNGSLSGVKQGIESQSFLYTRVYIRGLWPFQSSTITLARFHDFFMPSTGNTGLVFRGDGQNFNIHTVNPQNWDLSHPRWSLHVTNNDVRVCHDVIPGGFLKLGKQIKESIESGASEGGYRSETSNYLDRNSFISTFSSLGHLNPYQNWSNPLNKNLLCASNRETPFDSYFGNGYNTEHTTFNKESVKWLKEELLGNKQLPNFPIDPNALTGNRIICNGNNTQYKFEICSVPSPVVNWSVSDKAIIISSTPYSVILKGN